MKPLLVAVFAFAVISTMANGQDFRKQFSLEVGVGPGPIHMQVPGISPSRATEKQLAQEGRALDKHDGYYPAVTLSGALRTSARWETVATVCVSWRHGRVIQYESFGVDPQGEPRYDLSKGTPAGWMDVSPVASLTIQERVAWNPEWKVRLYSAFGVGLATFGFVPLPSVTPVGCCFGGDHLYFFAEIPLSPYATLVHGGIGWKF